MTSIWIQNCYALLAFVQDTSKAYRKIVDLFKQNLARPQHADRPVAPNSNDPVNVVITALDLLILLLPHLARPDALALFELMLSPDVLTYNDNGVQKRAYKVLGRLIESGKVTVDVEDVLKAIEEVGEALSTPAMKVGQFACAFVDFT